MEQIVKRKLQTPVTARGNSALVKRSLASSSEIAVILDLATSMMRTDLTAAEIQFWKVTLQCYPTTAVQWAFQQHLRSAVFFPKPAEIIALIELWQKRERERLEEERQRQENAELEAARSRGELFGLANVWTQFQSLLSKMTMPEGKPSIETRNKLKKQAREIEISPARRQELKQQVEEVQRARS